MTDVKLSRGEKILIALYELAGKTSKSIRYEDIVVRAYEKYPDDFHLKGYPQYPESGDLVHKPLYDYKKKGLIVSGNKMFALTDKGVVSVEKLVEVIDGKRVLNTDRFTRDVEKEVNRAIKSAGFVLFIEGKGEKVNDTDFLNYLGVTVRSTKSEFLGRLKTMDDVIKIVASIDNTRYMKLAEYNSFLNEKFESIITYKTEKVESNR